MGHSEAAAREKPIYPTLLWCHPRTSPSEGVSRHGLNIPLPGVCHSALSLGQLQLRLALSKLEKLFEVRELEDQTGGLGLM